MKVTFALHVGCIVQLHTLHESRALFPGKAARATAPARAREGFCLAEPVRHDVA